MDPPTDMAEVTLVSQASAASRSFLPHHMTLYPLDLKYFSKFGSHLGKVSMKRKSS